MTKYNIHTTMKRPANQIEVNRYGKHTHYYEVYKHNSLESATVEFKRLKARYEKEMYITLRNAETNEIIGTAGDINITR